MKKKCELCKSLARMHCESDQANLCWTCDYEVHAANFLVARHSRTLLCHVCQSPTPWTAAGANFGRAVTVCDGCAALARGGGKEKAPRGNARGDSGAELDSDESSDGGVETSDEEEEDDLEEEDAEIDDEDNQVVPWSPTTPPPASPSSNSDGDSDSSSSAPPSPRDGGKRPLQIASDLPYNANHYLPSFGRNASSPPEGATAGESHAVACSDERSGRNLKRRGLDSDRVGFVGPNSRAVLVDSVKKLRREEMRSSAAIGEFCRLHEEDTSAVDSDFSESSQPYD